MNSSVRNIYVTVYTAVFTLTCVALESPSLLSAADCNTQCTAGWVTIGDILGGIECEHGPEQDADCQALACYPNCDWNAECWELNGNMGNCKCFECGLAGGCEGEIRVWLAQCGKKTAENDGTCVTHPDENAPLRQERGASVAGGGGCNFGTNGYELIEYCGNGEVPSAAASCKSSNCAGAGAWTTVDTGERRGCGD